MKRVYLVCPECRKVTEFVDVIKAWVAIKAFPCEKNAFICYEEEDLTEYKHLYCKCSSCETTFSNRAEDFAVVIENGKIKEVGDYWLGGEDRVAEILKKEKLL